MKYSPAPLLRLFLMKIQRCFCLVVTLRPLHSKQHTSPSLLQFVSVSPCAPRSPPTFFHTRQTDGNTCQCNSQAPKHCINSKHKHFERTGGKTGRKITLLLLAFALIYCCHLLLLFLQHLLLLILLLLAISTNETFAADKHQNNSEINVHDILDACQFTTILA